LEPKKNTSALNEIEGVVQPEIISPKVAQNIQQFRRKNISSEELISRILRSDKVALSRAITLVESTNPIHLEKANEVINGCLPFANRSIRIGITGVPGVGKSTFIEAFGKHLTSLGKKVAVLAIDPSSSLSHGSILGDKTRMEELVKDENAYIRPSASGDSLGGVARKTREAIILCEACGFDTIIIETVGVGQSETAVHSMVDFFLLLKIAGAGDQLQGIKRGIMEMCDALVITKADGENTRAATFAMAEYKSALHFYPPKESGWHPKVAACSALENKGVPEILDIISEHQEWHQSRDLIIQQRLKQDMQWMEASIKERILDKFFSDPEFLNDYTEMKSKIYQRTMTPFQAADSLSKKYLA